MINYRLLEIIIKIRTYHKKQRLERKAFDILLTGKIVKKKKIKKIN